MKSIVVTYPYFQSLPKGVKMMLVASESFFFNELLSPTKPASEKASASESKPALVRAASQIAVQPVLPGYAGRSLLAGQSWWRN